MSRKFQLVSQMPASPSLCVRSFVRPGWGLESGWSRSAHQRSMTWGLSFTSGFKAASKHERGVLAWDVVSSIGILFPIWVFVRSRSGDRPSVVEIDTFCWRSETDSDLSGFSSLSLFLLRLLEVRSEGSSSDCSAVTSLSSSESPSHSERGEALKRKRLASTFSWSLTCSINRHEELSSKLWILSLM